ncbi:MAG: sporulation integral membrane protein YlbJ [Tepidibacter sp.]|jgi:sporulation integral membrane protein YlbJ|uniref:sporulation integral membrane protein YlbJ n=1 Tax=Tepidibacter sp. TaxID=2529387 RepID=UPI0025D804D0|nr:sporulation integral membrane protein YlbJ [Tepidibacter sp.]MCT4508195.1 sporulation integral membrane protein YlbJ [Tepidibacter sp.]
MKNSKLLSSILPGIIVLFFIMSIVIFPKESIESAIVGMNICINILIPSLLPFLIGANLLINLKVMDILGVFLEKPSRILFNVPGKSSLIFAISILSGYPIGSKLTSNLRQNNQISKVEAQRLASFCSTSGPLFIVGSVGIGMFNNSKIGYFILLCHYIGALSIGILFRFYNTSSDIKSYNSNTSILTRLKKIIFYEDEEKGFYSIFGDSVRNGINTILVVCGFVIVFSVLFKILTVLKFIDLISSILFVFFHPFNISIEVIQAFISGLFEITIGCNNVSLLSGTSLIFKISICTFIISFSGISILAQCCNFLSHTDINIPLYIFGKLLHGVNSFLLCYILYPIFKNTLDIQTFNNSIFYNIYVDKVFTNIPFNNSIFFIFIFIVYILTYINDISKKIV